MARADASAGAYDGVPSVGEHTSAVLTELLGLSASDVSALAADGVLSRP